MITGVLEVFIRDGNEWETVESEVTDTIFKQVDCLKS